MKPIVFLLLFGLPAVAGEYAVLASGARLYAERHESDGGKVTLFNKAGSTEMDASQVVAFEQEDYLPPSQGPASAPAAPSLATSPSVKPASMTELVDNAARKYGLPPAFVRAVVAVESGYQANAVSPKGAVGLMQLMPATARELGADPKIPEQNVDAGTRYLRDLLLKYDNHAYHALAAYNAGPGAVDKYHGVPPYRETQNYILSVLRNWKKQPPSD
ncbi:MAG TPA: lytic transglycosylase domain-containing protein [Bryobacteraceae bacterium]|nr:lytic transglycosylase domain-containing protein [Bryobacteraceae bacterium]